MVRAQMKNTNVATDSVLNKVTFVMVILTVKTLQMKIVVSFAKIEHNIMKLNLVLIKRYKSIIAIIAIDQANIYIQINVFKFRYMTAIFLGFK